MRGAVKPWREGQTQELAVDKSNSRDELEDSPKEETETGNTRIGAGGRGGGGAGAAVPPVGSICGPPSDCWG